MSGSRGVWIRIPELRVLSLGFRVPTPCTQITLTLRTSCLSPTWTPNFRPKGPTSGGHNTPEKAGVCRVQVDPNALNPEPRYCRNLTKKPWPLEPQNIRIHIRNPHTKKTKVSYPKHFFKALETFTIPGLSGRSVQELPGRCRLGFLGFVQGGLPELQET